MANVAKITKYCIANGEGLRTAVFFSGCDHHCRGCFNQELWDYNYGKPYCSEEILSTIDSHTAGLSLLGGDPLCQDNINASLDLCKKFKSKFPNKTIWLWTGWTLEYVKQNKSLSPILEYIDVLIDGPFLQNEYDYDLKWRGSRNQRILYKGIDF